MPIGLALRGRRADDDHAAATWHEVLESLRAVDRVFSTYREDSYISRLGRGELAVGIVHPKSEKSSSWARLPTSSQEAPSTYGTPEPMDAAFSTRAAWSRAGRCNARPRSSTHSRKPTSVYPPAATWCAGSVTPTCPRGRSASKTHSTPPGSSRGFPSGTAPSRPPVTPIAAPTSSTLVLVDHLTGSRRSRLSPRISPGPTSTAPPRSPSEWEPSTGSARDPVDMGSSCGRTGRRRSSSPGARTPRCGVPPKGNGLKRRRQRGGEARPLPNPPPDRPTRRPLHP